MGESINVSAGIRMHSHVREVELNFVGPQPLNRTYILSYPEIKFVPDRKQNQIEPKLKNLK